MNPILFSGIEVEGIYKGKKTLFVQGRVKYSKIIDHLMGGNYEQIYFGAKYKCFMIQPSDIDYIVVESIANLFPSIICTIEVEATSIDILKLDATFKWNAIIVIKYISHIFNLVKTLKEISLDKIQIKFFKDSMGVILIPAVSLVMTDKEDYDQDDLIVM
jgi:hypothetical protein